MKGSESEIIMEDTKQRWQAEQMPYPRDADYVGAKGGLFDMSDDAEKLIGTPNAGDTFIYLFRRFGYPKFGWDGFKHLIQYHITTPMAGVALTVEPDVPGGGTFGYMLREDISEACDDEDNKPWKDRYERFEAWAIKEHGIETMHIYFEPDQDKLKRVWQTWAADKDDADFADVKAARTAFYEDQANITNELSEEYLEIEPHPEIIPLEDRTDGSIMKQCHTALCAAIMDLLRPVYVRDVMINISGFVGWNATTNDDDAVKYAPGSGSGVGDRLEAQDK